MFKLKRSKKSHFVTAVIAAGGTSSRMNGENKLLLIIAGKPVLAHTLLAFQSCECITEIIISAHESMLDKYKSIVEKFNITKVSKVVIGGKSRLHSVYNAAINANKKADIILVHDGARPLIQCQDITNVINGIEKYGCASAANKITDTVKCIDNGFATNTVDRNSIYTVQTPQGADRDLLISALQNAVDKDDTTVTDECSALEKLGAKPYLTETSRMNIKLTYPDDIILAEAIFDRRNMS